MSLSLPHRLSLGPAPCWPWGLAAGCTSRNLPPEAEPAVVVSPSPEELTPPEQAEHQPPAEDPGEVEGGVEGEVVGGVVGGVLGGVLGGTVGGTSGEVVLPFGATRPSRPEPKLQATSGNTFEAHAPNAFTDTREDPLSTFAVDVDTASYSLARRYLTQGSLPPPAAVRVEEFVNYFKYRYAPPEKGAFTVHLEGAPSPFAPGRHFLRVGVQGKVVSRSQRKPAHLVFLVDTSGSMQPPDRLPLAKEAMKLAVKNLNENDTVAIVTYAGSTRDVLRPRRPRTGAHLRGHRLAAVRRRHGHGLGHGAGLPPRGEEGRRQRRLARDRPHGRRHQHRPQPLAPSPCWRASATTWPRASP